MDLKSELNVEKTLAEFIGTFALVFVGCGAIMVHELHEIPNAHLNVSFCFGLAVAVMIYACGHVSGAHFNPAVTLAFATTQRFPWREVPLYLLAQTLGALVASTMLLKILGPVAHLGASTSSVSSVSTLLMEFILTFFLMWVITAVATDHRAEGQMAGLAIGGAVMMAALMGGPISGASLNPARSFGPAFVDGDLSQIWLYVLGPIAGAWCGAFCYQRVSCPRGANDRHQENQTTKNVQGCC